MAGAQKKISTRPPRSTGQGIARLGLQLGVLLAVAGCAPWAAHKQGTPQASDQGSPTKQGSAQDSRPVDDTNPAMGAAASAPRRDGSLDGLRQAGQSQLEGDTLGLAHAWRLAQLHDPHYQAALSARRAAQEERAVGRSALLPQVQASAYRGRVKGERRLPDAQGQMVASDLRYDTTTASLQLQQPLLDMSRWADFRSGQAQAVEGEARFLAQHNAIALRLAEVYVDALLAQGRLSLQNGLVRTLESRVKALAARFAQAEGTRTEVAETQARLALAQADALRAQDDWEVALEELALMTGQAPERVQHVAALEDAFAAELPQPDHLVHWLDLAQQNSPEIILAERSRAVARATLDQAKAEFLPNAHLIAQLARADSEDLAMLSQKSNTFTIGVQLNVPIFAGGYTSAQRAQASARLRVAENRYRATVESVHAEVVRQFSQIQGGVDQIEALEAAEASARFSLEATNQSFEYGIAGNLDVLKAQEALHQAQHQLLSARLDYLEARVRLAAATGILQDEDLTAIARQRLILP